MLGQLKTHLVLQGVIERYLKNDFIGKRMFNFKFTVMRQLDLQRIAFLGFKLFKIFENFKTTFRYYYLTFASLFNTGQCLLFMQ